MRRSLLLVGAILLAGAGYLFAPTQAEADPLGTITLCHATSEPDGRGVIITVSRNVEDGHRQHGDCGAGKTIPDEDGLHCTASTGRALNTAPYSSSVLRWHPCDPSTRM